MNFSIGLTCYNSQCAKRATSFLTLSFCFAFGVFLPFSGLCFLWDFRQDGPWPKEIVTLPILFSLLLSWWFMVREPTRMQWSFAAGMQVGSILALMILPFIAFFL